MSSLSECYHYFVCNAAIVIWLVFDTVCNVAVIVCNVAVTMCVNVAIVIHMSLSLYVMLVLTSYRIYLQLLCVNVAGLVGKELGRR